MKGKRNERLSKGPHSPLSYAGTSYRMTTQYFAYRRLNAILLNVTDVNFRNIHRNDAEITTNTTTLPSNRRARAGIYPMSERVSASSVGRPPRRAERRRLLSPTAPRRSEMMSVLGGRVGRLMAGPPETRAAGRTPGPS